MQLLFASSFKGAYCHLLNWSMYCNLVLLHNILQKKRKEKKILCWWSCSLSLCVHVHLQAPPTAVSTAQHTCPSSVIKHTWPSLSPPHTAHQLRSACGAVSKELKKFCVSVNNCETLLTHLASVLLLSDVWTLWWKTAVLHFAQHQWLRTPFKKHNREWKNFRAHLLKRPMFHVHCCKI